ncbi:MAG: LamG domain-containing protein [Pirellulales bacterium]|nr:LamG domain-containing protein [Pirellulales bacterium]
MLRHTASRLFVLAIVLTMIAPVGVQAETMGSSNYAAAVQALSPPIYLRLSEPTGMAVGDPVVNDGTLGTAGLGMTWGLVGYESTQPISGVDGAGPDVAIDGQSLVGLEDDNTAAQFIASTGSGVNSRLMNVLDYVATMDQEEVTYSFFFKTTDASSYPRVITSHPSNANRFDLCMTGGMWSLVTNGSTTDTADNKDANERFYYNDGQWHHLVAIRQGDEAADARLYIDGEEVSLVARDGSWSAGYGLRIGSRGNVNNGWTGTIDEVVMWNRALSDTEARGLYQASTAVPEPSTLALLATMLLAGAAFSRRRFSKAS